MNYTAEINIMPREELLDPQGKATEMGLKNLGLPQIQNLRIGKRIHLNIAAASEKEAREMVETACSKLLVNSIMESYEISLHSV